MRLGASRGVEGAWQCSGGVQGSGAEGGAAGGRMWGRSGGQQSAVAALCIAGLTSRAAARRSTLR